MPDMPERPKVYRTGNIERLEHFKKLYGTTSKRDHARIAMEHAQVMHELLLEIVEKLERLSAAVDALNKRGIP